MFWKGLAFVPFLSFSTDTTRTWVIGDSIVFRASQSDPRCPATRCLQWFTVRGAKLIELIPMLNRHLKTMPAPRTLVIHLGTNDLFSTPVMELRCKIKECLCTIQEMLPTTRIAWSDILYRLFYYGETKKGVGKKNLRALNKFAHMICRQIGKASAIIHAHNIKASDQSLFWCDGLHLSAVGNTKFCENLHNALAFFSLYPDAHSYPVSA